LKEKTLLKKVMIVASVFALAFLDLYLIKLLFFPEGFNKKEEKTVKIEKKNNEEVQKRNETQEENKKETNTPSDTSNTQEKEIDINELLRTFPDEKKQDNAVALKTEKNTSQKEKKMRDEEIEKLIEEIIEEAKLEYYYQHHQRKKKNIFDKFLRIFTRLKEEHNP